MYQRVPEKTKYKTWLFWALHISTLSICLTPVHSGGISWWMKDKEVNFHRNWAPSTGGKSSINLYRNMLCWMLRHASLKSSWKLFFRHILHSSLLNEIFSTMGIQPLIVATWPKLMSEKYKMFSIFYCFHMFSSLFSHWNKLVSFVLEEIFCFSRWGDKLISQGMVLFHF